jgi:hypothetical protein
MTGVFGPYFAPAAARRRRSATARQASERVARQPGSGRFASRRSAQARIQLVGVARGIHAGSLPGQLRMDAAMRRQARTPRRSAPPPAPRNVVSSSVGATSLQRRRRARNAIRGCPRRAAPRSVGAKRRHLAENLGQRRGIEHPRAQDARSCRGQVKDGRLDADLAGPPSSTMLTAAPNSSRTWAAVVGLTCPKRLADGAATPPPNSFSSCSARGWFGTRSPTVSCPPVMASITAGWRLSISVRGPGQKASARRCALSGMSIAQRESCAASGKMHDQWMVGRTALGGKYLRHGLGIARVGAQAIDGFGRERRPDLRRAALPPRGIHHSSRMPIRRRAASADSWTCCASLPMTVKCPILRPGRAWCLP